MVDHITTHLEQTSLDLLPGFKKYVPWPGEIADINMHTTMTLLSAVRSSECMLPASKVFKDNQSVIKWVENPCAHS